MAFSERIKKQVKEKAAFRCCRCQNISVEVHHIIPEADGGPDTIENAAPLCPTCHSHFGNNPKKRKEIMHMREWWYERVRNIYTAEYASGEQLSEIYSKLERIHHNHGSDLADLKRMLQTTSTVFSYSSVIKKFANVVKISFQPLTKHPIRMVIPFIIMASVLYAGMGLAELVRQNSDDMLMLSAEMLTESGPYYTDASSYHARMIRQYTEHMEQRHLAVLLRVLYPKYSPKKALASALSGLETAAKDKKEEEARKAIWQAGLASNQLYTLGKRFPQSPIEWFKSEDLPYWLLTDLNNALADSHLLVNKLEEDPTVENALVACEANRKTILLLFLARLGCSDKEAIKQFMTDVKRAHDYKENLAATMEDGETKSHVLEWAHSEQRRAKILQAMLDDDMDRVRDLLCEAIEMGVRERKCERR